LKRTLGEIARHLGGTLVGDEGLEVQGVNALDLAGPEEISFYSDPRYRRALEKTRAGALITAERLDDFFPSTPGRMWVPGLRSGTK